jgi:hypothetical protein
LFARVELAAFKRVTCLEESNPVLYLESTNGTFERKMMSVPYYLDFLRVGRHCNAGITPTSSNLYFDTKSISRQHAEIYSDMSGRIWIRDTKSSNGTFINGHRLAAERQGSKPHELRTNNELILAVDIFGANKESLLHHRVPALVQYAGYLSVRLLTFLPSMFQAFWGLIILTGTIHKMKLRRVACATVAFSMLLAGQVPNTDMI